MVHAARPDDDAHELGVGVLLVGNDELLLQLRRLPVARRDVAFHVLLHKPD